MFQRWRHSGISIGLLALALFHWPFSADAAKSKDSQDTPKGIVHNDMPAPYNLQAVVLNKNVTLNWQWMPPEQAPAFTDFGFEVRRNDGKTGRISGTTWSEFDLAFGTYSYIVRLRAGAKERGKRVTHISDWSEPAQASIRATCPRAPIIELTVEPTKHKYERIPSLRLHLTGHVSVDTGCSITAVSYRIESGTGITHTGHLPMDDQGRFDSYVDALGPEDEIPQGSAVFSVTATAADEAGPTTSSAYSLNIQLENPYAPENAQ